MDCSPYFSFEPKHPALNNVAGVTLEPLEVTRAPARFVRLFIFWAAQF
jgi:hypothetical protein